MFDVVMLSMFLALLLYRVRKNKLFIKQLTKVHTTGVLIAYLATITIGFSSIYYVGNHLTGYLQNGFIKFLAEILIIIMVISFCSTLLSMLKKRIINPTNSQHGIAQNNMWYKV